MKILYMFSSSPRGGGVAHGECVSRALFLSRKNI